MKDYEIEIFCHDKRLATTVKRGIHHQEAYHELFKMGSTGYESGSNTLFILEDEEVTVIPVEKITHYKVREYREPGFQLSQ